MGLIHSPIGPSDGLVLCLDTANRRSYPGSGTNWFDLSGNGNHGVLTNGPTLNTGPGGGMNFDGVNDYIETAQNVTLQQQCTISMCLIPRIISVAGILAELTTDYNRNSGLLLTQETYGFAVYLSTDIGAYPLNFYNGTTYNYTVQAGKAIHLTALYDRSLGSSISATRLYINGILQSGTQPNSNTMSGNFTAAKMFFGSRSGGIAPLNGVIDDIKVYNRNLSPAEIRQLFEIKRRRYL